VSAVRAAAELVGGGHREIISGAGHDACYLAGICPTAMVFIPCRDGISHNPTEWSSPEWCAAGANVLLHATLALAGA
jgi:N-carbamoyl-L-amino-acid hydrolase